MKDKERVRREGERLASEGIRKMLGDGWGRDYSIQSNSYSIQNPDHATSWPGAWRKVWRDGWMESEKKKRKRKPGIRTDSH